MSCRRTDCYVCVTWLGGELCARATSSCSCFLESDDDTHLLGASYLKISFFSDHARASLSGYSKCVCMSFPFPCIHCDARVLQWLHYLSCPHPNLLFVMVHVCVCIRVWITQTYNLLYPMTLQSVFRFVLVCLFCFIQTSSHPTGLKSTGKEKRGHSEKQLLFVLVFHAVPKLCFP